MECAWRLTQQRSIRFILHQRVLKEIGCPRRAALSEQQTRGDDAVERRAYIRFRSIRDRRKQRVRELASDCRSNLRYLLGRAEPVEPRHQRGVQACRNGQERGGNSSSSDTRIALAFCLQHGPCHFLNEERDAISTLDYV